MECGICFTSVDGNDEVYRLSACSHGFHLECLQEMFKFRLKDACKDYPIGKLKSHVVKICRVSV